MQTQSAIVRANTGLKLGAPNTPGPACVIGLAIRCEDRKPPCSSPETMMSSASSRRSGNAVSVARVPSISGRAPMLTPPGVSTAQFGP